MIAALATLVVPRVITHTCLDMIESEFLLTIFSLDPRFKITWRLKFRVGLSLGIEQCQTSTLSNESPH